MRQVQASIEHRGPCQGKIGPGTIDEPRRSIRSIGRRARSVKVLVSLLVVTKRPAFRGWNVAHITILVSIYDYFKTVLY